MESVFLQRETTPITSKGNHFFKPTIQKKLSVGSATDSYEVEADTMANRVMSMKTPSKTNLSHSSSSIQKKCAACEQEEKIQKKSLSDSITPLIQRSSTEKGGEAPTHVENQINNSRGKGSSMDNETRTFMESRFGTDFSEVKIHTGSQAVQMSRELNAQAFTVGNDIYFNAGKYNPSSENGKHLLAHELTHTIQQTGSIGRKLQKSSSSGSSDDDSGGGGSGPTSGNCRVDVRATKITGLYGLPVYHLFIITHDSSGFEHYYRGGPSTRSGSSYGPIVTTHGNYLPGTIDWDPSAPSVTVEASVNCATNHSCLVAELSRIDGTATTYVPTGPNSNSVVRTCLRNCSLTENKPVMIAPGWGQII